MKLLKYIYKIQPCNPAQHMKTFFWLLIACIFIHCKNPTTYRVIVVQPLGNFTEKEARLVFAEIRKVNPQAVLRKSMPFPTMAFYQPRNRYRADSLIKFLSSRVGKDTVIIGLSQKDISTSKGKNKD